MAPQTGTAILVIAAFVLPGFVTLLLRERTDWVRGEDTAFERLLNALYYSWRATEGRGLLLRITLDDGRIVGGFFGEESLAGYTAHTRDLFLEERWSLDEDDWFLEPVEGSRGLWISDAQIRSVEAYAPPFP